jgi:hypothetical protein
MIFSNLTLSGFMYSVVNPGLLTMLNNHVVIYFGRSKPEGGTKRPTETRCTNFQYKRWTTTEKSVNSDVIHDHHNPTQYYAFSSNIFNIFGVPDMFRICNHAHG